MILLIAFLITTLILSISYWICMHLWHKGTIKDPAHIYHIGMFAGITAALVNIAMSML